jgi:dipeptidyl-peptidase-4
MTVRIGLAILLALPLAAQKKPVTIEAITSMRSPRGGLDGPPIWAPDGKAFLHRRGDKVMLYDVAAKNDRELLSIATLTEASATTAAPERFEWENRGVHEDAIQWMPSGQDLLISAGRDLFVWHISNGKYDQLTNTAAEERDPKPSPDGRSVAFRRNHDLYVIDLASRKETRLTTNGSDTLRNAEPDWVYPEELSLGTAYWWSPDSRSIAYLQFDTGREPLYPQVNLRNYRAVFEPERYPQAGDPNADVALGVVPAAGGITRWMDVGSTRYEYLIARVEWMPDGRRLAVERLTRIQDRLDLLAVDSTSGDARVLLRESDPYWVNVTNDLRFLEDGKRFLWTSERDGFRQLYLYSMEGKLLRQLTDGDWEVRGVLGIDPRTDRVFYLSSEAGPLETHLFSVRLNGKDKARLTGEAGWHSISLSPSRQYFVDSFSSSTTPAARVLRTAKGAEYAVLSEPDRSVLNEYEILPSDVVKIMAADGRTELYGSLTRPAGFQPGRKYPAIVLVYGGPGVQSVTNSFKGLSMEQMLAHRGYVVWQVDNRGTIGRGRLFESAVYRSLGTVELADQKAGVDYLTSLGFVDAERIGIYGWSYGGFMTLNSMLNAAGTFRAGIAGAPVTNFANYDTIYTERYMGLPLGNPEGYKKTDLAAKAGSLKGNLMIIHNFEDDNVLFQNTLQMADALERAGKRFDLMIYPQRSHGVGGPVRKQMLESMMEFFDRTLKM